MNLAHESCVVTGAAKGIGRALVSALAAAGARVIASDVDAAALAHSIGCYDGKQVRSCIANVALAADMARLAREAQEAFGALGIWINNAGLARHRAIPDYTPADIDLMLDVNLKGTILGS